MYYIFTVYYVNSTCFYIFVRIFENGVEKFNSRSKRAFFCSPETIFKVDDIKLKRKVSAFFLPLPLYLPFIALLSPFFARLQGLKKALHFSEVKVRARHIYIPIIIVIIFIFIKMLVYDSEMGEDLQKGFLRRL